MRKFIDLVESLQTDLQGVRSYLRKEYWHPIQSNPVEGLEVWEHMDDPRIGSYIIKTGDGQIESVRYVSSLNPIFNRTFDSIGEFMHHVSGITNDVDDEGMERGAEKMAQIARQLRGQS